MLPSHIASSSIKSYAGAQTNYDTPVKRSRYLPPPLKQTNVSRTVQRESPAQMFRRESNAKMLPRESPAKHYQKITFQGIASPQSHGYDSKNGTNLNSGFLYGNLPQSGVPSSDLSLDRSISVASRKVANKDLQIADNECQKQNVSGYRGDVQIFGQQKSYENNRIANELSIKQNVKIEQSDAQKNNNIKNISNIKLFGTTEREQMFIFVGTIQKIIKWNKIFRNRLCYFEVIAVWKGIEKGKIQSQNIMLLQDRQGGPILQVIHYNTTPCNVGVDGFGQMLRCIGRMIGPNIFNAISIRPATIDEVDNLRRHSLICDQAIAHYLAV